MKKAFTQILIVFTVLLSFKLTRAQTYKVFNGDTINRTDAKGLKQGLWKRFYDNDQPFSISNFKNGIAIGTTVTYYKSGEKQGDLIHDKDGKTAHLISYWPNGKIKAKGKYLSQQKDSIWSFYNEVDSLTSVESYKLGKANGLWKVYYLNGKISEETMWVNGKKSGPFKKYYPDGKIKSSGNYKDDSLEGTVIIFHTSGKPEVKGEYQNGLMNGKWLYMSSSGTIDSTETYVKGVLQEPSVK